MPKTSRNTEERKRRYAVIFNATGDVKLARAGRDRSNKWITEEYGVRIPKTLPRIKTFTPEQLKRKQREFDKYRYARVDLGLDVESARYVKQYSKRKIITTSEYFDAMELATVRDDVSTRQARYELWVKWSHDKALPPMVHRMAISLNRQTKNRVGILSDDSDFGYTIAFAMFVDKMSLEMATLTYQPDPWDGVKVMYMDVSRVRNA